MHRDDHGSVTGIALRLFGVPVAIEVRAKELTQIPMLVSAMRASREVAAVGVDVIHDLASEWMD
jgi:hypothetical protein